MTNAEIAKILGCSTTLVRMKRKAGWSEERILNTPIKGPYEFPVNMIPYIQRQETLEKFGYDIPKTAKDRFVTKCDTCGKLGESSAQLFMRVLRKSNRYRCSPCQAKSPEGKKQRSEQSKKNWEVGEYRERITTVNSEIARSSEGRAQRSKQSKDAWNKNEYRAFHEKRITELFQSDEHRKLVSERNKASYRENPEKYLAEKVSVLRTETAKGNHTKALSSPEYRETHRKLAIKRFENPEYKKKHLLTMQSESTRQKLSQALERRGKYRVTDIEQQVIDWFVSNKVSFEYNKSFGPYCFDFLVGNFLLEINGSYWHGLDRNIRRDKAKATYVHNQLPQYKLIVIWDHQMEDDSSFDSLMKSIFL